MALDRKTRMTLWIMAIPVAITVSLLSHKYIDGHIDRFMFSEVQAQTLTDQVEKAANAAQEASQAASATGRALTTYMRNQDLKETRERLSVREGQLSDTLLWESSNGANDISRARKADLQREIEDLKALLRCYEAVRPDCG
jgi:acyl-CoA reductase-like NAD-dependent aldehyde dehydrogenase